MKYFLIYISILISTSFQSLAADFLERIIEVKKAQCASCPFEVYRKYKNEITPDIYAIHTPFAYRVRAEAIWMESFRKKIDGYQMKVVFEKNEFPMDEYWDTIWTKNIYLKYEIPLIHQGLILDRQYRMTFTVYSEEQY